MQAGQGVDEASPARFAGIIDDDGAEGAAGRPAPAFVGHGTEVEGRWPYTGQLTGLVRRQPYQVHVTRRVAVALGDVQRNRLTGTKPLIPGRTMHTGQRTGFLVDPRHVPD
mgnify:CR=1 FL=1